MRPSYAVAAALALSLGAAPAAQADPAPDEIAKQAVETNMFSTSNARATLDLDISKDGAVVRNRKISTVVKRADGVVRTLALFEAPADVAGTKFLSVKEKDGSTQQYIYLPAFKKVKRVVGAQRGQSFMGTDFSYADLEGGRVDDSSWKRLADDKIQGEDCYVVEGTPKKPEGEEYGRSVFWVHKRNMIPLKTELYDKPGKEVVKRLVVNKLAKKDEHFVAMDSVMETVKKGTQTRLRINAIDFKSEIPDDSLTREALER